MHSHNARRRCSRFRENPGLPAIRPEREQRLVFEREPAFTPHLALPADRRPEESPEAHDRTGARLDALRQRLEDARPEETAAVRRLIARHAAGLPDAAPTPPASPRADDLSLHDILGSGTLPPAADASMGISVREYWPGMDVRVLSGGVVEATMGEERCRLRCDADRRVTQAQIGEQSVAFLPAVEPGRVRGVLERTVATLAFLRTQRTVAMPSTLRSAGGTHLAFEVPTAAGSVRYVATAERLLRVAERRAFTEGDRRALDAAVARRNALGAANGDILPVGSLVFAEHLRAFPTAEARQRERERILGIYWEYAGLDRTLELLRQKQAGVVCTDVADGTIVHRTDAADHFYRPDGTPWRIDRFDGDRLVSREAFTADGRASVDYYPNGTTRRRATWTRRAQWEEIRRPDGSIERVKSGGMEGETTTFSAADGKRTHVIEDTAAAGERFLLLDPAGATVDPLTLPPDALVAGIGTPERYLALERFYWQQMLQQPMPPQMRRCRQAGREICGLAATERALVASLAGGRPGVRLALDESQGGFGICDTAVLRERLPLLLRQAQTYPPSFFRNATFRVVYVAVSATNGSEFGVRRGSSDDNGSLVLNLSESAATVVQVFHHELVHEMDRSMGLLTDDSRLGHVRWWNRAERGRSEPAAAGFSRDYGRTNSAEDKATIGEALFIPERSRELRARAAGDLVLRAKIRAIEAMYYAMSDGRMDQRFWAELQSGARVGEEYWRRPGPPVRSAEGEAYRQTLRSEREMVTIRARAHALASVPAAERQPRLLALYIEALAKPLEDAAKDGCARSAYRLIEELTDPPSRVSVYQRIITLHPRCPSFLYSGLGREYREQGDKVKARATYREGMAVHPESREAFQNLIDRLDE